MSLLEPQTAPARIETDVGMLGSEAATKVAGDTLTNGVTVNDAPALDPSGKTADLNKITSAQSGLSDEMKMEVESDANSKDDVNKGAETHAHVFQEAEKEDSRVEANVEAIQDALIPEGTAHTDEPGNGPATINGLKREAPVSDDAPSKRLRTEPNADEQRQGISETTVSAPTDAVITETRKGIPKHQGKVINGILRNIKRTKDAFPFLKPVDFVALNIPHYPTVITNPMDLDSLEKEFHADTYANADDLKADFYLIVDNAEKFNGPESPFTQMAGRMKASFDKQWNNLPPADAPPAEITKKSKRMSHSPAFALAPSGLPQIRRESVGGDGRPKREIHPPKNRDLPAYNPRRKKNAEELRFCNGIIKELLKKQHEPYAFPFYVPVDPVAMNIPDYFKLIKKPMDLSTVQGKINNNLYESAAEFEEDIRLMFRNCYKFNAAGTPVHNMGKRLEALFDVKWMEKPARRGSFSGDGSSDDDSDREHRVSDMQRQLQTLQEQIEMMSKGKKSVNGHHRSNSVASKKKEKKNNKKDGHIVIDYAMKQELADKVGLLEGDALQHAVDIIRSGTPSLSLDEDEVELDLESMDPEVLQRLYKFVVLTHGGRETSQPAQSRKNSAANMSAVPEKKKKHKPMNETEQDAAIRAAQRKLAKFRGEPVSPSESESESSSEGENDEASSSEEE